MEQAIILILILCYSGTMLWMENIHVKERDVLTKKIMARDYSEYAIREQPKEEAPTAEELFSVYDEDEAYALFMEEHPDKIPILED